LAKPQEFFEDLKIFVEESLSYKEKILILAAKDKEKVIKIRRGINKLNTIKIPTSSFYYLLKKLKRKGIIKIKKRRIYLTFLGFIVKIILQKKLEKVYIEKLFK